MGVKHMKVNRESYQEPERCQCCVPALSLPLHSGSPDTGHSAADKNTLLPQMQTPWTGRQGQPLDMGQNWGKVIVYLLFGVSPTAAALSSCLLLLGSQWLSEVYEQPL